MGFEVSGTYALLFLAFLVATGAFVSSVENAAERTIDANAKSFVDEEEQLETSIEIVQARWDGQKAVIEVENTGEQPLSLNGTDFIIDGEYVSAESIDNRTVDGNENSTLWAPDEVLRVEIPTAHPSRLRVVTAHGISVFTSDIYAFDERIVFTQGDRLRTLQRGGTVQSYGVTNVNVIGPVERDFDGDGVDDIPYITTANNVQTISLDEHRVNWTSPGRSSSSRVTYGYWDGNPVSIYYVRKNELDIRGVQNDSTDNPIVSTNATGIGGIADIDDDGSTELIYGNGSNAVSYLNAPRKNGIVETRATFGADTGIGLGQPGDFDGDGTPRVPVVDANGDIALANATSINATLTTSGPAAASPLATLDWDGDDRLEIVFVGTDGDLRVLDDVTGSNSISMLEDGAGQPVSADKDAGVA